MINIDKMIQDTRIEHNISPESLYTGICSRATYFNYENGKRTPDFLTFQGIMQRLGRSSRDFTYYVSEDEYRYLTWTNKARLAIKEKCWKSLEELLHIYQDTRYKCNENIQIQYKLFLQVILEIEMNKDIEKALELVIQALRITKPDFDGTSRNLGRLTELEISLMILGTVLHKKRAEKNELEQILLLKSLIEYVKHNISDEKDRIQIQSKLVYILIRDYGEYLEKEERISICREAVKLLCKKTMLYLLPQLLQMLVSDIDDDTEEAKRYKKQLEALREILKKYGGIEDFSLYEQGKDDELFVQISEYLYYNRMEQTMTQQEMAEGICEPENYSRIETGKRKPKRRNYQAFTEKLGIECQYYSSELDTDDYRMLELKREIDRACTCGELKREELLLDELEQSMNHASIKNRQFYETMRNANEFRQGRITAIELAELDKKVLSYTMSFEKIGQKNYIYSQTEILLVNHIANAFNANNQLEESVDLLRRLLNDLRERKFLERYERMPLYFMTLLNLGQYYSDLMNYDMAIKLYQETLCIQIKNRNVSKLSTIINELAYAMELKDNKNRKLCDELYRHGFYISDLFNSTKSHEIVKEYYEKNYNSNIKWY